jgi:hypothetical protein
MSGIHVVYLVLALIFAIFITYMFVYNIRQNNRQKAFRLRGGSHLSRQEAVMAATEPKENTDRPGIS